MSDGDVIFHSEAPLVDLRPWQERLESEKSAVSDRYWELYYYAHQQYYAKYVKLYPNKAGGEDDPKMLPEEYHEYIDDMAHDQCERAQNMIWFGVWDSLHDDTKTALKMPTTIKAFCEDWLGVTDRTARQWRQRHGWFFDYLRTLQHVGKKILEAYKDAHFRVAALEGLRRDSVGRANREYVSKVRGDFASPAEGGGSEGGVFVYLPDNKRDDNVDNDAS